MACLTLGVCEVCWCFCLGLGSRFDYWGVCLVCAVPCAVKWKMGECGGTERGDGGFVLFSGGGA